MAKVQPSEAIVRLPDGTVKQKNLLTGTEVWTIPGRDKRPLPVPAPDLSEIAPNMGNTHCAFCSDRYLETPPEKSRVVRPVAPREFIEATGTPRPHETSRETSPHWPQLDHLRADQLFDTVAEFRRIPNLFEIVSYSYWAANHGHIPSEVNRRRMADYLSSPMGYDHVMGVVRAKAAASGLSSEEISTIGEPELLNRANGFFSGGHDVIVARRHYVDGATNRSQLCSSGELSVIEHRNYIAFTVRSIVDLYGLDPAVAYVVAFQNWLKPAGASFDHLHKQLVAIDQSPVQTTLELSRLRKNPRIYDDLFTIGITRGLLIAQNDYAIAFAGFGHRFPTVAVWPLGPARQPWEYSPTELDGISDVLHAVHRATGAQVPCNEEWYHRPVSAHIPMRWRILLKWRLSTVAGFEGGSGIYLNTIDPWQLRNRLVTRLEQLRDSGEIADGLRIGGQCSGTPALLV